VCFRSYLGNGTYCYPSPCLSDPCQNGDTCQISGSSFNCNCPNLYNGTTCQNYLVPDNCASSPCQNGATCNSFANSYNCTCLAGYSGTNCQALVNDCLSVTCFNGGTCINEVNAYYCNCSIGWTGTICGTTVNCTASSIGNANYSSTQAGFTALGNCIPGYTGSPSRLCTQSSNGTIGIWKNPVGSCVAIYCSGISDASVSFPVTQDTFTANSTCNPGYSSIGIPTRTCSATGTWLSVVNPCLQLFCPNETYDNAYWDESTATNSYVIGECVSGYAGMIS